jgi:uncharacterized RDD family membrane protein YckC
VSSPSLATTTTLQSVTDELVIETPERVELYYTRAQVGNRFLAAALDHIIQAVVMVAILLAVWMAGDTFQTIWQGLGTWALAIVIMATFAIYTTYFIVFETIWNGQTPGKRVFRLRVIREDGRPIRFYEALVRNLLRTALDSQPVIAVPLYSVGIVSIFLSPRSKRVGDYVAGTVVIRESETRAPSLDDVLELARDEARKLRDLDNAPFTIDTSQLSVADELAVRAFLRRRHDLGERVRTVLGNRIAASLAVKLGVPPLALTAEQVLEEIDRQSRVKRRDDRRP